MATARPNSFVRLMMMDLTRLCPLVADVLLGGLFLYAGLAKVWPPGTLAASIAAYRVLPELLVLPVAHILPWWEIAWGLALLGRRLIVPSRIVLVGLLVVYGGAAFSAWVRSLDPVCGCFGGAGAGPGQVAIRNVLLVIGLTVLWTWGRWSLGSLSKSPSPQKATLSH